MRDATAAEILKRLLGAQQAAEVNTSWLKPDVNVEVGFAPALIVIVFALALEHQSRAPAASRNKISVEAWRFTVLHLLFERVAKPFGHKTKSQQLPS